MTPRPRRKRSEVRQRTCLAAFRLLPAEQELVSEAAEALGVSLSEFIRSAALAAARKTESEKP